MNDPMKLRLDTGEFRDAMVRLRQFSKREGKVFVEEQVRGFIRNLLDVTPPNRGSRRGVAARKAGERAVAADIRAVFRGVSDEKRAEVKSFSEMEQALKARRKPGSMRVRPGGTKIRAQSAMIRELVKMRKARVGNLASAWASAARGLGKIRVPGWIARHSAPGSTRFTISEERLSAQVVNAVEWASNVDGITRRVRAALQMQTRAMERRLDFFVNQARKRSGF